MELENCRLRLPIVTACGAATCRRRRNDGSRAAHDGAACRNAAARVADSGAPRLRQRRTETIESVFFDAACLTRTVDCRARCTSVGVEYT